MFFCRDPVNYYELFTEIQSTFHCDFIAFLICGNITVDYLMENIQACALPTRLERYNHSTFSLPFPFRKFPQDFSAQVLMKSSIGMPLQFFLKMVVSEKPLTCLIIKAGPSND